MKVLTVSELTAAIKNVLEAPFRAISLCGEVSNVKLQSSGHIYFSLKDANAQISAVLFRSNAGSLTRLLKEGDQVTVQGEISLYAPRGSYQIVIRSLQFAGQGELLLKLHALKETLQKRGWFDPSHKKALPKFPRKIGVITSPTGAVIQDILQVLHRRFSGFHLLLNPVKVQGSGAAEEIAQAIQDFNTYKLADVLIVGRGGGSIEDLWAFNEEIVAKAIFESQIPIISAVGHETDVTIADFVADIRAPTPSAAAEMAIGEKSNILQSVARIGAFLGQKIAHHLTQQKQRLQALQKHPLLSSPQTLLSFSFQKLDDLQEDLDNARAQYFKEQRLRLSLLFQKLEMLKPSNKIQGLQELLKPYPARSFSSISSLLRMKKEKLATLTAHLHSLNPKTLLKKGYTLLQTSQGDLISSAKETIPNQPITVLFHDGQVSATIQKVDLHDALL